MWGIQRHYILNDTVSGVHCHDLSYSDSLITVLNLGYLVSATLWRAWRGGAERACPITREWQCRDRLAMPHGGSLHLFGLLVSHSWCFDSALLSATIQR